MTDKSPLRLRTLSKLTGMTQHLQDDGVTPVRDQNQNWFQIGSIYFASTLLMVCLSVGSLLGSMSDFWTVAIGATMGATVLALIGVGSGIIAWNTKLGIAFSSKFTFGKKGAYFAALIMALSFLGWYGVELEIFGNHFKEAFLLITNRDVSLPVFLLIIAAMGITVIIPVAMGFHLLKKCAMCLMFILFALIISFLMASKDISLTAILSEEKFTGKSLGAIISIVIGTWAAGYIVWGDFVRFARSKRDVTVAPFFASLFGFLFMLLVGALLSKAAGEYDLVKLMLPKGGTWSVLALVWLALSTWMINAFALYIATLSTVSIFDRFPRWKLSILLGVVAVSLAMLGITQHLLPWVLALSVLMPPILAVIAIDYFVFMKKEYEYSNIGNIPTFRWYSLVSCLMGSVFGLLTHFRIFSLTSSSAVDAIIGAAIIHFIVMLYKR